MEETSCRADGREEAPQASQESASIAQAEERDNCDPPSPSKSAGASTDSDAGCSCCPTFVDAEAGLTQRRSHGGLARKAVLQQGTDVEDSHMARGTRILQERALWLVLMLACSVLLFCLLPLESRSGISLGLGALWTRMSTAVVPRGRVMWEFKWRFIGAPDPRPLYNITELGAGAIWPHGSAEGFAAALGAGHIQRVAVVGNGPVTDAQRQDIATADRVIRFNAMNNRKADERVDVWVVRYNKIPPHMYWGFQQLGDAEIQGVLQQAKAVLFLGGSLDHNLTEMHESVEKVLRWFPGMTAEQIQQINFNDYWEAYNAMFTRNGSTSIETADTMPSSGLLGLLAVLAAVGPEAEVDLYGFNWSLQSYKAHIMNQEELIVRALARSFRRMDIHPTACSGLYTCETICDTGQFRLAVDEEHCRIQVKRERQGSRAKFVDLHTIHNLDWYPAAKKEAEAKLGKIDGVPARDKSKELEAFVHKVKSVLRNDDISLPPTPAPAPRVEEEEAVGKAGVGARPLAMRHVRGIKPGNRWARF